MIPETRLSSPKTEIQCSQILSSKCYYNIDIWVSRRHKIYDEGQRYSGIPKSWNDNIPGGKIVCDLEAIYKKHDNTYLL